MGTSTARLATSPPRARPRLRVLPGGASSYGRDRVPQERCRGRAVGPEVRTDRRRPVRLERVPARPGDGGGRSAGGGGVGSRARRSRLRLTRRGRWVVRLGVLALVVLVVLALVLLVSRPASAGDRWHAVPVRYHVVVSGETLWGIAGQIAPDADRRDMIARIIELNALPDSVVSAGQRIALPPVS